PTPFPLSSPLSLPAALPISPVGPVRPVAPVAPVAPSGPVQSAAVHDPSPFLSSLRSALLRSMVHSPSPLRSQHAVPSGPVPPTGAREPARLNSRHPLFSSSV